MPPFPFDDQKRAGETPIMRLFTAPEIEPVAWCLEFIDHGQFIRRVDDENTILDEAANLCRQHCLDGVWIFPLYQWNFDHWKSKTGARRARYVEREYE